LFTEQPEFKFVEKTIFGSIFKSKSRSAPDRPLVQSAEFDFIISNTLGTYYSFDSELKDECCLKSIEYLEYSLGLKPKIGGFIPSEDEYRGIMQGSCTNMASMYFQTRQFDQAKKMV